MDAYDDASVCAKRGSGVDGGAISPHVTSAPASVKIGVLC